MAVGRERQNESSDTDDNDFINDRSTKDKQASIGSNSKTNDLVSKKEDRNSIELISDSVSE